MKNSILQFIGTALLALGITSTAMAGPRALMFMKDGKAISYMPQSDISRMTATPEQLTMSLKDGKDSTIALNTIDSIAVVDNFVVIEKEYDEIYVYNPLGQFGLHVLVDGKKVAEEGYYIDEDTYGDDVTVVEDSATWFLKDTKIILDWVGDNSVFTLENYKRCEVHVRKGGEFRSSTTSPFQLKGTKTVTLTSEVPITIEDAATRPAGDSTPAALYSLGNLVIEGVQSLNVKGNYKHAIAGKGDIEIMNCDSVGVAAAADSGDAIHAKDILAIYSSVIDAKKTMGDGLVGDDSILVDRSSVEVNVTADDAKGMKSDGDIKFRGEGTTNVMISGQGSKGIKAGTKAKTLVPGNIYVEDGANLTVQLSAVGKYASGLPEESSPAGLKSDGDIVVSGGTVSVQAPEESSSVKGFAADGNIKVTGGKVNIDIESLKGKSWGMKAGGSINLKKTCITNVSINPSNTKIDSGGSGEYSPEPTFE